MISLTWSFSNRMIFLATIDPVRSYLLPVQLCLRRRTFHRRLGDHGRGRPRGGSVAVAAVGAVDAIGRRRDGDVGDFAAVDGDADAVRRRRPGVNSHCGRVAENGGRNGIRIKDAFSKELFKRFRKCASLSHSPSICQSLIQRFGRMQSLFRSGTVVTATRRKSDHDPSPR